jgi:hypothetical protein
MPFGFNSKKTIGKSPGGSTIFKYAGLGSRNIGASDEPPATKERETAYAHLFGECSTVYHEVIPQVPHIDVYTFPGGQKERNFCTLATGGMSDRPMKLSKQAEAHGVARRVELIFYCSEPRQEYLETLRFLAQFPHAYSTWVGNTHTIPNGNPPTPLWTGTALDTVLLMPTVVRADLALPRELTIGGDAVEFLWVVPLSKAECELKLAEGFKAIMGLFERNRHPHVFNGDRASYC